MLSEISETNARGQVIEEFRNDSAFAIVNSYNDKTGLLETQKATTALAHALGTSAIQDQTYAWDTLGNLTWRLNKSANVGSSSNKNLAESFCYDGLNRLKGVKFGVAEALSAGECSGINDITYDGLGNITSKKDVGEYAYGSNAGPHAVTRVLLNGSATHYSYDANGNLKRSDATGVSDDRTFTYTRYDMVKEITKNNNSTTFSYGADRARWKRVDVKSGVTTTTTYLGNIERIQKLGSTEVEWKRYVGNAIFTYKTDTNNKLIRSNTHTAYVFNDHLGSVDVVTDANGKVTNSMSFDPWGNRRDGDTWGALSETQRIAALKVLTYTSTLFSQPITQRGYTGHEMVDDMGIIHMNGRIYDPKLARFIQADPFIQAATNTQSYNRYSYVLNNPLNATDPSGFFFSDLKPFVGIIVAAVATYICSGNVACGKAAWAAIGAVSGAAQAAATGGNIVLGAITGMITGAAGGGSGWGGFYQRGIVGGIVSSVMGGKFGHGFISAGIGGAYGGTGFEGFMVSTAIGGAVSVMTGGKFKNGAATAAFMWALRAGLSPQEEAPKGGGGGASADANQQQTGGTGANQGQSGERNPLSAALSFVGDIVGKIWALPNTLIGLVYGGVGHVAGWIMGTNPYITFGNNAIQFHNNPLMPSAMTLGNVIVYGPSTSPNASNVHFHNTPPNHTVGREEFRHTQQAQILGPLYLPAHAIGGISSLFRSPHLGLRYGVDAWHSNNFMETGPMQDRTF